MSQSLPTSGSVMIDVPASADTLAITEDSLLDGRVRLRQPARGYRAAIDPVLLAAAVPASKGDRALDLGCGAGGAALCLLARCPEITVDGLELQAELVALAEQNAELNGVAGRFRPVSGDVLAPPAALEAGSFDHVFCNPPHLDADRGPASPTPARKTAMSEGAARLEDWIGAALAMVRSRGSITLVHRADRLDHVLACLSGQAGAAAVHPLWPGPLGTSPAKPAKRVIVRAWKGRAGPLCLLPGLALHDPGGRFTAAAERVLRDAQALDLQG